MRRHLEGAQGEFNRTLICCVESRRKISSNRRRHNQEEPKPSPKHGGVWSSRARMSTLQRCRLNRAESLYTVIRACGPQEALVNSPSSHSAVSGAGTPIMAIPIGQPKQIGVGQTY